MTRLGIESIKVRFLVNTLVNVNAKRMLASCLQHAFACAVSALVGKRGKTKDVSVSVSCGYVGVYIIRCNVLLVSIILFCVSCLCCQPLSHLSAL